MKKNLLYFICAVFCLAATVEKSTAQVFVYDESFNNGQTYCPGSTNYDNWGTFRASLLPLPYLSVTISGSLDLVGVTCDDPAAVAQIAANLNSGTETNVICNGITWRIGASCITGCAISGDDVELNAANTGADCSCGGTHTVRPCIGNANWGGIGASGCGAPTQNMRVEFFAPSYANDAGVAGILNPSLPTCGLDSQDVTIKIQNLGNDTLFTATINWTINGGTVSTFNYTGAVAPQGGCDTVVITNATFTNGDSLAIWSSSPNGAIDSLPSNDTSSVLLSTGLAGTYLIPGDFADLAAATQALESFGVCDHVIMDIASGTYNEQVTLGTVLGVSPSKTVTFQGTTGDPLDVIVEFDPSANFSLNGVVQLNGSSYVTFKDMTIDNLSNTFSYGRTVVLAGNATNNTITNCEISGSPNTTTSTNNCVIYANSAGLAHNSFTNNHIMGGSYAIYYYGNPTTHTNGVLVENNFAEDFYYYGIYCYYNDSTEIIGNEWRTNVTYTSIRGIYVYDNDKQLNIESNYVSNDETTGGAIYYGIYIGNSDGSLNNRLRVANNCIVGGNPSYTGFAYTFYINNSGLMDVHNNTITRIAAPTSTSGYTHYLAGGGLISEKNNSFVTYGSQTARYVTSAYSLIESENNNYYSNGTNLLYLGANFSSVEDFSTATSFDMNSVNTDPVFNDTINCATCSDTLDGAGDLSVAGVDILGNVRSVNTPDIGAVEYIAAANFTLGPDTTVCGESYLLESGPAQSVTWLINGVPNSNPNVLLTASGAPSVVPASINLQTSCGAASDDIIVTLVPGAALDSSQHICANATASITPGGGGTATYMWSTSETTASIDVNMPGTYSVTKMEEGCESSATIVVTQSDAVDILDLEPCADDVPITIDATINDGISYAWSAGTSMNTAINTFDATGSYSITATDAFGCTDADTFSVLVVEDPTAVILYTGSGGTGFFFNSQSSSFLTSTTTYNWTFEAGQTSTLENPFHSFPWNGTPQTYTVTLEIDNGCETDLVDITIVVDPLGIPANGNESGFSVFPNPANTVLNVSSEKAWSEMSIDIIDVTGRILSTETMNAAQSMISMDVDHLAAGNYVVRINADGETSTFRVIIE